MGNKSEITHYEQRVHAQPSFGSFAPYATTPNASGIYKRFGCMNSRYLEIGLVEGGGEVPFGDGHPDGVGDALPEGPRGHLHPGGNEVLRVTGGKGVELPEVLQVVYRDAVPGRMPTKTMIGEKIMN